MIDCKFIYTPIELGIKLLLEDYVEPFNGSAYHHARGYLIDIRTNHFGVQCFVSQLSKLMHSPSTILLVYKTLAHRFKLCLGINAKWGISFLEKGSEVSAKNICINKEFKPPHNGLIILKSFEVVV